MKLSRLYSNRPEVFEALEFRPGLNAAVAEIRLPQNRKRDTHNLGKTTIGKLLDFCFLASKDPKFFLFKHLDVFESFVFFLEVELEDASYVTIRRSVEDATRVNFKKHQVGRQDLSGLPPGEWDHQDVPFERARELLDGLLDWRALKPWSYRKVLGYLLRSQEDFREVFQLRKFASKHADWKPFLAHLLGFDAGLVAAHYDKEQEFAKKQVVAQAIKNELGGSVEDVSKIEGMLLLKNKEAEKRQKFLDEFDFRDQDKKRSKELVENVDEQIASLNAQRYSLNQARRKIVGSLTEDRILFDPDDAKNLFKEAGVWFEGQIKRDFEQLIAFNLAITEERRGYLVKERAEIDSELRRINSELSSLGARRSEMLSFLTETDAFAKYKRASTEMVDLRAGISLLETQREHVQKLQKLRAEIRALDKERVQLQAQVEANVEEQNSDQESMFSAIRVYFSETVEDVIDRKALLSVSPNSVGHLEFRVEILDESGNATSAGLGHTYRKLLCVAFDLAVLRAHLPYRFPRFVYHDGVFESLDDRKKENLLRVLRKHADLGLQSIITLIDSDLPAREEGDSPVFDDAEILLTLHDEGVEGRLFKFKSW